VCELSAILGPGHYEEPTWVHSAQEFVDILQCKFQALALLSMQATVESSSNPPLLDIIRTLRDRGVRVMVTGVKTTSGRVKKKNILESLRAAGIELGDGC
ncbi:unnamed protein product, partial [Polarella glacialis]